MTLKEEQTSELSIAQITQLMANGMGNMLHNDRGSRNNGFLSNDSDRFSLITISGLLVQCDFCLDSVRFFFGRVRVHDESTYAG